MIDGYLSCSFDLLDVADIDVINQVHDRCDRLVVGVFSDEYLLEVTGTQPMVPLAERVALVAHVRGVDEVVLHDDVDLEQQALSATLFAVTGSVHDDLDIERLDRLGAVWLTPSRSVVQPVVGGFGSAVA